MIKQTMTIKTISILLFCALLSSGCSINSSNSCNYQNKSYDDGNAVFLRQKQNICLCEDSHWICIPVSSGGMEQGRRGELYN
jgi:hypothetical protein